MATTIGEQLRLAREERGIALRDICDQTRISIRYLEAIESNDYKKLPGGIFNRSFVKAYARYVGFDEKQAVEGYSQVMREQGKPVDDNETILHTKLYTEPPAKRSPLLTVLLAVVILAILALGAWGVVHWYRRSSTAATSQSQLRGTSGTANHSVRFELKSRNYEYYL
jgi:cytoskeleton protein RodZ